MLTSLVNAEDEIHYVKFHWKSLQGINNLDPKAVIKVQGQDYSHMTNDLVSHINKGEFPKWDLHPHEVTFLARILIADDHAVVRMAVTLLLEKAGHKVVGQADSGFDVIALERSLEPDLVILDIDMPQLDGFSVLQRLCGSKKRSKIVVFSGLDTSRYAIRCSRAGASAFVSKDGVLDELLSAVQIVLAGYTLFPTTDFSSVNSSAQLATEEALVKTLSDRELSVLRQLARGHRIKDIAQELMLSEKTASTYKSRLIVKLQVANFLELVDLAKRNDLI